jgi:hypothetical protein
LAHESLSKFPICAALGVPEIWRYDGAAFRFYALNGDAYQDATAGQCLPGLTPETLAAALEQGKVEGQTAALAAFRRRLPPTRHG